MFVLRVVLVKNRSRTVDFVFVKGREFQTVEYSRNTPDVFAHANTVVPLDLEPTLSSERYRLTCTFESDGIQFETFAIYFTLAGAQQYPFEICQYPNFRMGKPSRRR